jgi:thioredoxin 1
MVIDITKQNINDIIKNNTLVIIDFYAVWCGPCNSFKPTFEKVSNLFEGRVLFGTVNIDEYRDIAIKYNVSAIPMLVAIKNSVNCWSHTGTMTEGPLKEKIELLLK